MKWKEELNKAEKNLKINIINKHFSKTIALVAKDIILKTPKDTGRAQANWNSSMGAPDYSMSMTKTSLNAGQINIFNKATIKSVLYQANSLPYILMLEDGWSKQRPVGWVKLIQASFYKYVEEAVKYI